MIYLETQSLRGQTAAQQLSPAVVALTRSDLPDATADASMQAQAAIPSSENVSAPHSDPDSDLLAAAQVRAPAAHVQGKLTDMRPKLVMVAYYMQRTDIPSEVRSSTLIRSW